MQMPFHASFDAGFNKMPKQKAKILSLEINDL